MRITIQQLFEGPDALEKAFAALTPQSQPAGRTLEWFKQLINTLQAKKPGFWKKQKIAYFISLGYAYQQAAALAETDSAEKRFLLEGAYSAFKSIPKWPKKYGELGFYALNAQAQAMSAIGIEWPEIEEVCLEAYELQHTRAESLVQIIKHYLNTQEFPIALLHSHFVREHHYDHMPIGARWGLDADLYNWKLLDIHTAVCFNMGNMEEATQTFNTLIQRIEQQPELFTQDQIAKIIEKKALFQQLPA